jgi:hypothetical protein
MIGLRHVYGSIVCIYVQKRLLNLMASCVSLFRLPTQNEGNGGIYGSISDILRISPAPNSDLVEI